MLLAGSFYRKLSPLFIMMPPSVKSSDMHLELAVLVTRSDCL
jgi:hypothetical protein